MNVVVKDRTHEPKVTAAKYVLPLLLTTSMFINYIDRSNLSIAAPLIQKDMALSTAQIGLLSSAFFWTYALFQLLGISGGFVIATASPWFLASVRFSGEPQPLRRDFCRRSGRSSQCVWCSVRASPLRIRAIPGFWRPTFRRPHAAPPTHFSMRHRS